MSSESLLEENTHRSNDITLPVISDEHKNKFEKLYKEITLDNFQTKKSEFIRLLREAGLTSFLTSDGLININTLKDFIFLLYKKRGENAIKDLWNTIKGLTDRNNINLDVDIGKSTVSLGEQNYVVHLENNDYILDEPMNPMHKFRAGSNQKGGEPFTVMFIVMAIGWFFLALMCFGGTEFSIGELERGRDYFNEWESTGSRIGKIGCSAILNIILVIYKIKGKIYKKSGGKLKTARKRFLIKKNRKSKAKKSKKSRK